MKRTISEVDKAALRQQVWSALRPKARPDSRFHWNFAEFIPDFEGSHLCCDAVRRMDWYRESRSIFVTPDNGLVLLRQYAIQDQKNLIVSTYGIARGLMLLRRSDVPVGEERLAATLDGMEYFGHPLSLEELAALAPIDLLVTGAAVITKTGIRWGKGHGYFDLEWGMFSEIGAVDQHTPVVAVVHDCQVVDLELEPSPHDTIVDCIITPERALPVSRIYPKPQGIFWEQVPARLREQIPPLQSLYERRLGSKEE